MFQAVHWNYIPNKLIIHQDIRDYHESLNIPFFFLFDVHILICIIYKFHKNMIPKNKILNRGKKNWSLRRVIKYIKTHTRHDSSKSSWIITNQTFLHGSPTHMVCANQNQGFTLERRHSGDLLVDCYVAFIKICRKWKWHISLCYSNMKKREIKYKKNQPKSIMLEILLNLLDSAGYRNVNIPLWFLVVYLMVFCFLFFNPQTSKTKGVVL